MSDSTFPGMREALQQALHLRFAQALDMVAHLQTSAPSPLAAPLTRGIIAYFQTYWQTPQHPLAHHRGHQAFAMVLKEGHRRLKQAPHDPGVNLLLGLAAVFDTLLQQQHVAWPALQFLPQGCPWLQQALMTQETMGDAHLELGMLYFVGVNLPKLSIMTQRSTKTRACGPNITSLCFMNTAVRQKPRNKFTVLCSAGGMLTHSIAR
jgi:hypothetical protein